jgi:hypothetical protein
VVTVFLIPQLSPSDWSKLQQAFENPKDARLSDNAISFLDTNYKAIRGIFMKVEITADGQSIYAKNVLRNRFIFRINQES